MLVVSHRLAGITFRTESDVWLPGLAEGLFARFRVAADASDDGAPDVRHRIHRVAREALTLDPPPAEEQERLLHGAHVEPGGLDSPLLRAPAVRDWLREALAQPTLVGFSLYPHWVIGRDFAGRVLDFFYLEEAEADRQDEEPAGLQMGEDGELLPDFRIRPVDLDLQTAAPLTAEERERFSQGIGFAPPETVDLPLLRAPTLRTWLHACLDQSHRLEIQPFSDGVMVWNQNQSTLDFVYRPEFGRTAEARVAAYYRRLFATFLPAFSAQLIHSSGVIRGDRAALFLAKDEGGKSTVLRHAPEGHLLNDDQVIVQREGEHFVAHATPLGRLTSGPGQAQLGGLFVLEKAPSFELEPVQPAPLVRQLWDEHRVFTAVLPKPLKVRAFDFFYDMCHRVPVYRMRFP
ncbi:MAG: hypothetical protein KJ734_12390, partial [Chloroflexi bacterium]|nr:hypothetical protein [Chloroflexota bacterium]